MDRNSSVLFEQWHGNNTLSDTERHIITGFLFFTAFIAVLGNLAVLLAVLIYPCLRTATNMLLIGLLATDLIMVFLLFPLITTATIMTEWPFGNFLCQFYGFSGLLVGYASLGMLMVVSIDRYIHICDRQLAETSLYKYYGLMILCVWLNSAVWAIMPLFGWSGYALEPTGSSCTITWWKNDHLLASYIITVFIICYMIPIVVMVYCYGKCLHFILWVGSGDIRQENVEWTNEKDITKMCLLCVIGFFIVWTPYAVLCLWATFGDPGQFTLRSRMIPTLCAKSSAMINPVIYFMTNGRWRAAFKALLKCQKQHENKHVKLKLLKAKPGNGTGQCETNCVI